METNRFDRTKPKMSIIIPSWFTKTQHGRYMENETFWLAQECLKKLIERTPREDYELIIIDNGSTLDLDYDNVTQGWWSTNEYWGMADILIRNKKNLGFAPACNQGFAVARGDYICCLNNDIVVWPGWLDAMLSIYEKELDPKVGVVMPALMKETKNAHVALKLETIDTKTNRGKYGAGAEFGSLWIAKRELLKEVAKKRDGYQVYDENFKLGFGEDRWLWQEIRLLGFDTYRTHDTRVFHQGNMSYGKVPDRKKFSSANREYLAKLKKEHNIK